MAYSLLSFRINEEHEFGAPPGLRTYLLMILLLPLLVGVGSTVIAWLLLQLGVTFELYQALEIKIADMPAWMAYGLYGLLYPVIEVLAMVMVFVKLRQFRAPRWASALCAVLVFAMFSLPQGLGMTLITFYSGLLFLAAYLHLRRISSPVAACSGVMLMVALNNLASLVFIRA